MTTQAARQDRGTGADAPDRLPEEGELVEVRGQSWVVARVEQAPATGARAATLVHLQSVADGRFGDTLSVIWEVEPGRRVLDRGSLPDASTGRFDPPSRLAAFLDAVRWSAVASADVRTLQAPFRSGVAVEPYQLEPVSRAVGAPASTSSSPTTSASARPSKPAWSSRSCCCAAEPTGSWSSAQRV